MALSLNKYIRKRYKYKGSGIKENDLLCKLCYMTEERRVSKKKTNDANIIDEDTQANVSLVVSQPVSLARKRSNTFASLSQAGPDDMNQKRSLLSHDTPFSFLKHALVDVQSTPSSLDASSQSDFETKIEYFIKSDKQKFNDLLEAVNLSPVKDTYEDMEILVAGLKQLILSSDYCERIRMLTLAPPVWSRRDIAQQFSVSEWEGRMAIDLREAHGILAIYENTQDRNKISPETIEKVLEFYEDDTISRYSSSSKDTINIRQLDGTKKPIGCRFMLMSLTEAFELFKTISTLIQESTKTKHFVEKLICSTENNQCMFGECAVCRTKLPSLEIPKLYPNIDLEEDTSWMKWTKMEDRVDIHRISGSIRALLFECDSQWLKFTTHSYITTTQFEYIKKIKESLDSESAICQMDFTENYVQNEIMSKHWSTSQAALFTVQIKTKDQTSNIVIISNYLSHDTMFVHCSQGLICEYVKLHFPSVKRMIYLSDGCGAHFKNNYSMMNLMHHEEDFGFTAEWTSHGRGAVDGLGAAVKSAARRSTMRAGGPEKSLTTPLELYHFSEEKFKPKQVPSRTGSSHSTTTT
ncbi:unnamed protein product, partial [Didymodactylos carnosus]